MLSQINIVLFLIFVYANALLIPFLWNSRSLHENVENISKHPSQQQITFKNFQFLADQSSDEQLVDPKFVTVNNFNTQSDFKLLNIYPYRDISRGAFDLWVKEQYEISFDKILRNVGDLNWSDGLVHSENLSLGAVIASPSKDVPNYFYQWIRDGAITINSIINHLSDFDSFQNQSLQITVENYLQNSYVLQRTDNPSGKFDADLLNLGEPKFLVDSTPFTDNWGRPQNDGPPLRVITVDNFIKNIEKFNSNLIQTENFSSLRDIYYKIIKLDLQFIIKYWRDKNFDLWEEVNAHHFFTSLSQLKALKIGIKLYHKYDEGDKEFGDALVREYQNLIKFITSDSGFVNYNLNHIVETPSILDQRSGLDAAVLIGSLLTHDDFEDPVPFDVTDGLILNTLTELVKVMKYLYPVNHGKINLNLGVALGRYPEDLYDGVRISEGNPWFLTTLSASELLFKVINNLYVQKKNLIIDSTNQYFYFTNIIEVHNNIFELTDGVLNIPYNSIAFNQTVQNLFQLGDSFLDVIREHVSNDGSMSEQFNKYNGYMQGAENLTWSHGAYWSAYRWRQRAVNFIENK